VLEPRRPYGEPIRPFLSSLITFGVAREPWERSGYWELRRRIFCDEQRLFCDPTEEQDGHDARAVPIVAVAHCGGTPDRVVGMVRIFEAGDRTWYGGRLGVDRRYRARPAVGGGLIREAVCQALRRGCERFLATVQEPNVRYFTRFDFVPLQPIELHGRAHMLMQAELGAFARLAVRQGRIR